MAAAALLCVAALGWSYPANAAPHLGGGGFHGGGGGFHGGVGGFHGGGWHGGFAGVHNGAANWRGGHWYHGWHNGRYGGWWGAPAVGVTLYGYPYGWGYWPDYGYYGDYGSQYWYYCSDPPGYYPYVTQCNVQWQPVPAS